MPKEDDMEAFLIRLEALPLADRIRMEVWAFPIINTIHVIGIALLFGGIVVLDSRLLGYRGRMLEISSLARLVLPLAAVGFALAVVTGGLMFLANPREYWANPYFPWKLGLMAAAGVNALILHATVWRGRNGWGSRAPFSARMAGVASLGLWAGVITCGRFMAYF
jgi:hypothetical protein